VACVQEGAPAPSRPFGRADRRPSGRVTVADAPRPGLPGNRAAGVVAEPEWRVCPPTSDGRRVHFSGGQHVVKQIAVYTTLEQQCRPWAGPCRRAPGGYRSRHREVV